VTNPSGKQGWELEAEVRAAALRRGMPAQRYENNSPGRDVDVDSDLRWVIECKHRANLNAHKTVLHSIAYWPDRPVAVIWKRLSRKGDNARRTADGPTLACLPYGDLLDLLALARDAGALRDWTTGQDDELAAIIETIVEHLDSMAAMYPEGRI